MKKQIFAVITLIVMTLFTGCNNSSPESVPASEPASVPASISTTVSSNETISEPTSAPAEASTQSSSAESGQTSAPENEGFEVSPPFFKVENNDTGAVVYMLGSMHIGKEGAAYPDKMYKALDECDTLAVEVDIQALESDLNASMEATMILLCERGKTVRDYLGDDYEPIMQKFREKGLYNRLYESYIPALWSSLWTSAAAVESGFDVNAGTDRLLLTYAKEHGKAVEEIESAKEQYQMEAGNSAEMQTYTLKTATELSAEETKEQLDTLYDAWKSGDINTLKALAEDEGSDEDEPLPEELEDDYEKYYAAMYTDRQKKMADYIQNKLKTGGKTFVVVGALHYAAPPSILDILAENGYTVETLQ